MNEYIKLSNIELEIKFEDYVKNNLKLDSIDYLAIGLQDKENKISTSIMSSKEWQNIFCNSKLYLHDPIRKWAFNSKRLMTTFSEIDHIDSAGIFVMQQRKKCGIRDGIILIEKNNKYNVMLTLGTSMAKFNADDFLLKNFNECNLVLKYLKNLIIESMCINNLRENNNYEKIY